MKIKLARVGRKGMEHGQLFVVCFSNFFHHDPRVKVQDILEPLVRKDKGKDKPTLRILEGYKLVAGLNNSLDMTVDEEDVVVTLHDLLRGGAQLQDGSELTVQSYNVPNTHAHGTHMMVEQHPNGY